MRWVRTYRQGWSPTRGRAATIDSRVVFAANLKKYVAAYSKGLPGSSDFRRQALDSSDADHILRITRSFFASAQAA